jgi:hypothetical protein
VLAEDVDRKLIYCKEPRVTGVLIIDKEAEKMIYEIPRGFPDSKLINKRRFRLIPNREDAIMIDDKEVAIEQIAYETQKGSKSQNDRLPK